MSVDLNPQAEQMGDESMARNLAHQAEAIWPQELPLCDRYKLQGRIAIFASIRIAPNHAVWHVPVVSGRRP